MLPPDGAGSFGAPPTEVIEAPWGTRTVGSSPNEHGNDGAASSAAEEPCRTPLTPPGGSATMPSALAGPDGSSAARNQIGRCCIRRYGGTPSDCKPTASADWAFRCRMSAAAETPKVEATALQPPSIASLTMFSGSK